MGDNEEFRDRIATVDESGGRIWIYPKKPSGKFYKLRTWLSVFLLGFLFGIPFIKIDGDPLFLFNVIERKFIFFGAIYTPQDLHLAALAMITGMLFIVLFTVVFGRLFCGWICPQTIFMEMVFRKIEYWIEGDANQQRKLNSSAWTFSKVQKKSFKHLIFFLIALMIANTFLAYIIGMDEVLKIISEPISLHLSGFIAMVIFSLIFYWVFAFFREQVCTVVCPYGRLQGVLLVKESIVVIYDWIRGEPRAKIRKQKEDPGDNLMSGDCIDCHLCVKVCPTGIDIRNGTQLECVNCTACMDACDEVMRKVNRPEGLIRYDSHSNIESGKKRLFTPRVYAYSCILVILVLFQGYLLMTRSEIETSLLRTPGMSYQQLENGYISNLYNYQIVNKTNDAIRELKFRLSDGQGVIDVVGEVADIEKLGSAKGALFIKLPEEVLANRKTEIDIDVYAGDRIIDKVTTHFYGPVK